MKTEYGVVRSIDYQTGEVEIQMDSGLWIEDRLNPAEVQDMMSDDVVSVTLSQCLKKISEIARHYEHMAFLINVYEDMESEFAQYALSKIEETLKLRR